MTTTNHQASLPEKPGTTPPPLSHCKNLVAMLFFLTWLAYSACALGWAILDKPLGLACANHTEETR